MGLPQNLNVLVEELGEAAAPGLISALRNVNQETRLQAIEQLISFNNRQYDCAVCSAITVGLALSERQTIFWDVYLPEYIRLAGRWRTELFAEPLRALVEHESESIRRAAADALNARPVTAGSAVGNGSLSQKADS